MYIPVLVTLDLTALKNDVRLKLLHFDYFMDEFFQITEDRSNYLFFVFIGMITE
jgi:hypothetical protein